MHRSRLVNCTGGQTIGKTLKNVGRICDLAHEDFHRTLVESVTACQKILNAHHIAVKFVAQPVTIRKILVCLELCDD